MSVSRVPAQAPAPAAVPAPARPAAEPALAIETHELTKRYGTFTAVDGLNLAVREGEVFGLLGPNGAGKTTTILMLLGLTEPSAGRARVLGCDPTREPLKVKRLVGYLPDAVGFYDDLTARENLQFTAELNNLARAVARERIDALLERVGLGEVKDKKVGQFSRGMRQRLGIADVLVKNPRLIILDEPTIGLDPDGTRALLDLIRQLSREEGITVLVSSHLLEQVQRICDRVGIFVKGKLVAAGPIASLGAQLAAGEPLVVEVQVAERLQTAAEALGALPGVVAVAIEGETITVRCTEDVRAAIGRTAAPFGLLALRPRGYTLEDIYLRYFR
ncbi:MAG TPA: ABC transporter ATP-binding protein [Chloroflexota bacterium]|nr:ABC transporter ATP-binding protein [Chloroflexota bacterium]